MNSTAAVAGIIGRNPRESVGLFVAAAAIMMIVVNALFLQTGPHPAPIFAHKSARAAAAAPAAIVPPAHPVAAVPAPPARPSHANVAEPARNDPIAQLLAPSNRVVTIQQTLTEYGYGQIRPTGIVGPDTQEAIRKFERSRKMPVTGVLSEQVVKALAQMSGRPLD
jgi:peptidoglycan hydrolase-like protein with peptidoglycan-binding domain